MAASPEGQMPEHRERPRHDATDTTVQPQTKAIRPKDVAEVYRTLGLDSEATRRQYLDWYNVGQSEPKTSFEIVERGDTLTFE
jgi:hypothetical protein